MAEKRNVALLASDPVRPFLSSTVAANLAKEQVTKGLAETSIIRMYLVEIMVLIETI